MRHVAVSCQARTATQAHSHSGTHHEIAVETLNYHIVNGFVVLEESILTRCALDHASNVFEVNQVGHDTIMEGSSGRSTAESAGKYSPFRA